MSSHFFENFSGFDRLTNGLTTQPLSLVDKIKTRQNSFCSKKDSPQILVAKPLLHIYTIHKEQRFFTRAITTIVV